MLHRKCQGFHRSFFFKLIGIMFFGHATKFFRRPYVWVLYTHSLSHIIYGSLYFMGCILRRLNCTQVNLSILYTSNLCFIASYVHILNSGQSQYMLYSTRTNREPIWKENRGK
jgi:hypothetical protein